jgi:hypothetical protein
MGMIRPDTRLAYRRKAQLMRQEIEIQSGSKCPGEDNQEKAPDASLPVHKVNQAAAGEED